MQYITVFIKYSFHKEKKKKKSPLICIVKKYIMKEHPILLKNFAIKNKNLLLLHENCIYFFF